MNDAAVPLVLESLTSRNFLAAHVPQLYNFKVYLSINQQR